MRTATAETRRALCAALAEYESASAWARKNGARRVDTSDCLNDKPMSARRENRLRVALGLDPLRRQLVELAEGQRVVNVTPKRRNKRRAFTVTPDEAIRMDVGARKRGYRSAGAWAKALLLQNMLVD